MKNYYLYPVKNSALVNGYEISYQYDKGIKTVNPHHHEFYEVYYFINGNIEFVVHNKSYALQDHTLILLPPNTEHYIKFVDSGEVYNRIVLWISKDTFDNLRNSHDDCKDMFNEPRIIMLNKKNAIEVNHFFELINTEQQTVDSDVLEEYDSGNYSTLLLNALFIKIIMCINSSSAAQSEFVLKVSNYLASNIMQPINITELASMHYLSKYHFIRKFKQETGVSVYQYLIKLRLSYARKMLSQGYSAEQACEKCGYTDYSSFYKAFVKEYGISPKTYINSVNT